MAEHYKKAKSEQPFSLFLQMAGYRKRSRSTSRYTTKKRSRYVKRRRMAGMLSRKQYKFRRTVTRSLGFTFATASQGYGFTFSLDQLPSYTEFISLFDEYKLYGVKLHFRPLFNSQSAYDRLGSTTNLIRMPRIHYCLDNTDNAPPSNVGAIQQYSTYDSWTCLQSRKKFIKVNPAVELYRSTVTTGYGRIGQPFIECTTTGTAVPHYGFKLFLENPDSANWNTIIGSQEVYELVCTYYFVTRTTQ